MCKHHHDGRPCIWISLCYGGCLPLLDFGLYFDLIQFFTRGAWFWGWNNLSITNLKWQDIQMWRNRLMNKIMSRTDYSCMFLIDSKLHNKEYCRQIVTLLWRMFPPLLLLWHEARCHYLALESWDQNKLKLILRWKSLLTETEFEDEIILYWSVFAEKR